MPPLAWVVVFGFLAGALTFQVHLWTSILADIEDEGE
jgi:hypothetical protein